MGDVDEPDGGDGPVPEAGAGLAGPRAQLRAELLALGRGLDVPATDGLTMAERVMAQLLAEDVPVPVPVPEPPSRVELVGGWLRGHARLLGAALSGLLVVLVLTPPVRATVVDWFDFGGVEVRYAPSSAPSPGTPSPGMPSRPSAPVMSDTPGPDCGAPERIPDPLSPAEAARRAGFGPVVPAVLGAPDTVTVTGLPEGRSMVTLCWREKDGAIRLDEFSSGLDPYFIKQVRVQPKWLRLTPASGGDAAEGLWFAQPHLLRFVMAESDGVRWSRSERTAGPTLLWKRGERTTLRLEGVASPERARAIAESTL